MNHGGRAGRPDPGRDLWHQMTGPSVVGAKPLPEISSTPGVRLLLPRKCRATPEEQQLVDPEDLAPEADRGVRTDHVGLPLRGHRCCAPAGYDHSRRARAADSILVSTRRLPIVMTPGLTIGLFALTVFMCVTSAIAAIVKVMRIDPAMVFTR